MCGRAMRHILRGAVLSGGATLAVVTAQVFLIAQLHQDVAVGGKTKERNREAVDHGSTAGGEAKEQGDRICSDHSVQDIHTTTTNNLARRHECGLGCVVSTRQLGCVMGATMARLCFKHPVTCN